VFTKAAEPATETELGEWRWRAGHYQSLHARALDRERALERRVEELQRLVGEQQERIAGLLAENEKLRARQKWLEQQLFGRKSEQVKPPEPGAAADAGPVLFAASAAQAAARPRGQQPGTRGHGRKRPDGLPREEVPLDVPPQRRLCPRCGKALREFPWTEDSEEVHWDVRLIRRVYRRKRYLPACDCGVLPGIVAAPLPPKLIPRGMFSTEFWTRLLLEKFLFQRPLFRVRQSLALEGLAVSQGTLTGGIKRVGALLEALYAGIVERSRGSSHWHMDETRWLVFADAEGKAGHRWWLWVCAAADTCVFLIDPSRSAAVPREHLGEAKGIVNADRFAAYKALKNCEVAFCWVHVRRDFLEVQEGYPRLQAWGESWVRRIDGLFALNAKRIELRALPGDFADQDRLLRQALARMSRERDRELAKPDIHPTQRKVLESLRAHWKGLTLFVDRPDIPMDNNLAERLLRNPIVGRKNYYGSGSIWSGQLSAMLFTLFQTLLLNHIDPRQYLLAYFQACAERGGRPPKKANSWLPWNLTESQKAAWRYPKRPP